MKSGVILVLVAVMLVAIPVSVFAATLTVNTSSNQGALMYGGIGFLYGLATNTPSDAMITGLVHPQYTGQNAPNGLQHPDGYCNVVAPQAKRTGFKGVYICCLDIYAGWPYPNYGINDYLNKLDAMARTIVADPNRSLYLYNLLNESEFSWYSSSGTGLTQMCNEWKQMYQKVRSIDADCKIIGPSFAMYNGSAYRTFFSFTQSNGCMPDYASWHELDGSFFSNWYSHYNDFRSIPGCGSIPIMINEYGRSSGDVPIPGQLIQYLAKFENSNVYGCMPYWTGHGTLNDLVANNNTNQQAIGSSFNQPTGAWYLYQWYGQMTGNQVAVTPPTQEGSLQGIASKDGSGNVTVLFGGGTTTYDVNVVVQGLSGSSVNYTVYETTNTGRNIAPAPSTKNSGSVTVSNGTATISVTGCAASSAFKVYITDGGSSTPTPTPTPDQRSAFTQIEAESHDTQSGIQTESCGEGGQNIGYIENGDYVVYNNIDFDSGAASFQARVASNTSGGNIEIRLDSITGTLIGTCSVAGTGGWQIWTTRTCNVSGVSGTHNLFLRFTGGSGYLFNVNWFQFTPTSSNLITNPGMETGNTSGWAVNGAGSIAVSTAQKHSGTYSLYHTGRTATWNGPLQNLTSKMQSGKTYSCSGWVRLESATSGTVIMTIKKVDGSGTTYTNVATGTGSNSSWVQLSGNYTLNVTGTLTEFSIYFEGPASGVNYYLDDVSVQ